MSGAFRYGYAVASFTPSAAGTYTFLIKGTFQAYAEAKWTVNVTAPTTALTTAFINTTTGSAATADTTAASRVASAAASATPAAIVTVKQYSSTNGTADGDARATSVTLTSTNGECCYT